MMPDENDLRRIPYRIRKKDLEVYEPIFSYIVTVEKKNKKILVAIDGKSGSGKSHLVKQIEALYDCNIFHMDDFFLRPEQKSKERLTEIGGNVDYERIYEEVLVKIRSNVPFIYNVYNCQTGMLQPSDLIQPKKINILEGSYSHHPFLAKEIDYKLFLNIEDELQEARIRNRNGEKGLELFKKLWIPKENAYFQKYEIMKNSHLIIPIK